MAANPDGSTIAVAAPSTLDRVWFLETSGARVSDTSVIFAASAGRGIVMRHARPDDAVFLILDFPASTDTTRSRDSVHVRIEPVAGRYAFTLVTPDKLGAGVHATFSYAIHFREPVDANAKYPSAGAFEQALSPALLGAANKVQFIPGMRPAADVIRFPVTTAGNYALVAAR
ncbi:MAG: hypothetical protein ACRELE_08155 [Gemmatimonadales bacterium]